MQDQVNATPAVHRRVPWNKGKLTGAKPPLRPKHVWSIRTKLQIEGRARDLAMFNLAIDSKLRGCDVVAIRVEDVAAGGYTADRATVRQKKTGRPVRFELSEQTRQAIDDYLKAANKRPGEFLFTGRRGAERCMTTRQYARLVSEWIGSVDLAVNASLDQLSNQAGLFADNDSLAAAGAQALGAGLLPGAPVAVSYAAFDAVEKPLVYEVIAPALVKGFPTTGATLSEDPGPTNDFRCWDNIHGWGGRGIDEPLPSTPGAFHCAHLHWRWGGAIPFADPQFNPPVWPRGLMAGGGLPSGAFGPLLDPRIFMQTIRIAVVKNEPSLDPARAGTHLEDLSKDDWQSLFTDLGPKPSNIKPGGDLVLWYSSQVHREITVAAQRWGVPTSKMGAAYTGTIFLHGLFFAHDAEKTGIAVGTTEPLYNPKSPSQKWFRPPS